MLMRELVKKAQISTNTLLAEGDHGQKGGKKIRCISTNTLLAEGDQEAWFAMLNGKISTNTLLAEGDSKSAQKISTLLFKSNRPAEELPGRRA